MDFTNFEQDQGSRLFVPVGLRRNSDAVSAGTLAASEAHKSAAAPAVTTPAPAFTEMYEPRLLEPQMQAEGNLVRLLDPDSLVEAYQLNKTQGPRNKSDRELVEALLKRLFALGTLRRCRLPEDWDPRLDQLKAEHANFAAIVDFLQCEFALAEASQQPPRLPAILLDGPPGCGKTYFAEALSRIMGTGFLRVNLETGQSPSELTGTAAHWGNSHPGRLFDLLINGKHANPVVLLDEVDKAGGHREHSMDRALYALLDPGTAKEWADMSLPSLKMDLRHVIWILTSNDWRRVPTPLLSRMQVFHVREPSRQEALVLARRIFETTAFEFHRIEFSPDLPTSLATMLALYPLRVVHRLSRALIAAAVRDGRNSVEAKDFVTVGADRAALDAFLATGLDVADKRH